MQDAVNNDEPPLAINNHEQDAVNNDEQGAVDNTEGCKCFVCLDNLPKRGEDAGESVTTLPCMHAFHTTCIQTWAASQNCEDVQSVRCPCHCELNAGVAAAIGIEEEGGESD